jgi:Na+/H+-translocating membrane pyrophosphatase
MISLTASVVLIYICCVIGLLWALVNYFSVKSINLLENTGGDYQTLTDEGGKHKVENMLAIGEYIARGANAFLFQEYKIMVIFCAIFAIVIKLTVDGATNAAFGTTVAFLFGAVTSIISGFIGMRIAVASNYRTAYKAQTSLAEGFRVAFKAGCVMGFALSSLALLVLVSLIMIYRKVGFVIADFSFYPSTAGVVDTTYRDNEIARLYEAIAGYGLGGSAMALFGRVGGGIYTKAADVGADLVGKVEQDLPEDSPKNPATIADNVGDNVGDIAGMGSDLFGSFAEATCAGLVVLAEAQGQRYFNSTFQCAQNVAGQVNFCNDADVYLMYPLLLSALALIACLICSVFATHIMKVNENHQIEATLRYQLIISTIILLVTLWLSALLTVASPSDSKQTLNVGGKLTDFNSIVLPNARLVGADGTITITSYYKLTTANGFICSTSGLVVGLMIGLLTEYYTSNNYRPVEEVAEACKTGAATNIIYGLALGYLSTIFPVILLAIAAYISHVLLGMFGIALAALGMLSNLAVGLAVDAYGPISDNAGGIAEMCELGEETRHRTDALDAAGNTTAAIGKGFAIGSAAFVALSLYGAFITRAGVPPSEGETGVLIVSLVQVTDALVFSGLLIGAMLPYAFSAMTMKAVGRAALEMVLEVRRQLAENPRIITGEVTPDYERCIAISTQASLREMIAPGCLVILTPLAFGFLFGPTAVAGLLPGALVSGVQMAISSSNTGGAWDNAKKYIESGKLIDGGVVKKKGSDEHKAAVIGDTVGDPLKDTSGPSLNILIKLSAILSLVFTPFFQRTGVITRLIETN